VPISDVKPYDASVRFGESRSVPESVVRTYEVAGIPDYTLSPSVTSKT
jgi:hypothetical protein